MIKPPAFDDLWVNFRRVSSLEMQRKFKEAQIVLQNHNGEAIRQWFDIHAQNAGEWRQRAFNISRPSPSLPLDPVKKFDKYLPPILARDNYRCRYCSRTVIPKRRLLRIQSNLGETYFPIGRNNSNRNGFYLALCATLDHVVPHSLGGRTSEENLVSACWPCNYGKMNWTLEQVGLENPFLRDPLPLEIPIQELMAD